MRGKERFDNYGQKLQSIVVISARSTPLPVMRCYRPSLSTIRNASWLNATSMIASQIKVTWDSSSTGVCKVDNSNSGGGQVGVSGHLHLQSWRGPPFRFRDTGLRSCGYAMTTEDKEDLS